MYYFIRSLFRSYSKKNRLSAVFNFAADFRAQAKSEWAKSVQAKSQIIYFFLSLFFVLLMSTHSYAMNFGYDYVGSFKRLTIFSYDYRPAYVRQLQDGVDTVLVQIGAPSGSLVNSTLANVFSLLGGGSTQTGSTAIAGTTTLLDQIASLFTLANNTTSGNLYTVLQGIISSLGSTLPGTGIVAQIGSLSSYLGGAGIDIGTQLQNNFFLIDGTTTGILNTKLNILLSHMVSSGATTLEGAVSLLGNQIGTSGTTTMGKLQSLFLALGGNTVDVGYTGNISSGGNTILQQYNAQNLILLNQLGTTSLGTSTLSSGLTALSTEIGGSGGDIGYKMQTNLALLDGMTTGILNTKLNTALASLGTTSLGTTTIIPGLNTLSAAIGGFGGDIGAKMQTNLSLLDGSTTGVLNTKLNTLSNSIGGAGGDIEHKMQNNLSFLDGLTTGALNTKLNTLSSNISGAGSDIEAQLSANLALLGGAGSLNQRLTAIDALTSVTTTPIHYNGDSTTWSNAGLLQLNSATTITDQVNSFLALFSTNYFPSGITFNIQSTAPTTFLEFLESIKPN